MTFSPEDIVGQKKACKYCGATEFAVPGVFGCGHCQQCGAIGTCRHSSTNPKNDRSIPSRLESFLTGLMSKPNPPEKELYLGDKPPDNDAEVESFIDRKSVVDIAKAMVGDRVSESLLIRICDAVFNDGIAIDTLKRIAAMDSSDETLKETYDILEAAKLLREPLPIEHTEAVISVCRALLQYVMTHHGGDYKTGSFRYEKVTKTPFMAWRVKERIQAHIQHSEPILVNPGGFDSRKQVDQFYANFNIADIVLWSTDIWAAAIRGCQEAFAGTKLEKDLVSSVTPQFWQFDTPFTLGDMGQYQLHNTNYDCVGFVLLPIVKDFREFNLSDDQFRLPNGQKIDDVKDWDEVKLEVNFGNPEVKKNIENAVKFSRYGISVAIVFMPVGGKNLPPEIRFMRPMYDGDLISDGLLHATILAAAKFLTLKYVAKDDAPVCKKELKQDRPLFKKVRQGKVQVPPIKIINLRRAEKRERTAEEAKSDSKRQYNCWWLVDAHWRKQWYPSLQRNIPVRILGYPKGNFQATFKPPREKVYKAVR